VMLVSTDWSKKETSAVRYQVDDDAGVLTPIWTHIGTEAYAKVGGNAVARGDGGNVLTNYGSDLVIEEVDAEGQAVWRVRAEGTAVIFQAWPVPSLWPVDG